MRLRSLNFQKSNILYFVGNMTSMVHVSMESMKKREIKLPPLDKQKQIASLIRNFDALCNDLTSGLPAEIEARQKQYEYYRDKLLSFKELGA